jgi:polyphosphate kinase 2 (PPK2 family)
MNYRKRFLVDGSSKIHLTDIGSAYTGKLESREEGDVEIQRHLARLDALQYLLYADATQSLLIVLQALDAGGKDGVMRHLFSGMNPQGTVVFGFKEPTAEELAHDFLWRVHRRTPGKGQITIFNRSHYEDVLVVRVHKLVPKSIWSKRYDLINDFEETLCQG